LKTVTDNLIIGCRELTPEPQKGPALLRSTGPSVFGQQLEGHYGGVCDRIAADALIVPAALGSVMWMFKGGSSER